MQGTWRTQLHLFLCAYLCLCQYVCSLDFLSSELFWAADFLLSDDERQMFLHHSPFLIFILLCLLSPFLSSLLSLFVHFQISLTKSFWFWSRQHISVCHSQCFSYYHWNGRRICFSCLRKQCWNPSKWYKQLKTWIEICRQLIILVRLWFTWSE